MCEDISVYMKNYIHIRLIRKIVWLILEPCAAIKLTEREDMALICDHDLFSGEGFNRVFVDCDPSAHGEVVAIRNAGKNLRTNDLQGCSLYTNFEPCPMCTAAIWWSRFVSNGISDLENMPPCLAY